MKDVKEVKEIALTDLKLVSGMELAPLSERVGMYRAWLANRKISDVAARELEKVEIERVKAQSNIALTTIKLAEATIRPAVVANAMPRLGVLTVRVNALTATVDQSLTNGSTAEVYTHLNNRASNHALAAELHAANKISAEEAEVIRSFASADANADIVRSRDRMAAAKETVSGIHEFALKGIADAKNRLN